MKCVLPILAGLVLLVAAPAARACNPVAFSSPVYFGAQSFAAQSFAAPGCFGAQTFAAPGCYGAFTAPGSFGFRSSSYSRFGSSFEEDLEEDFEEGFSLDSFEEEEAYQVAALRGGFGLRSGFLRSSRSFPLFRRSQRSALNFDLNLRLRSSRPRILFRGRSFCR
jgi:hypothetical protein